MAGKTGRITKLTPALHTAIVNAVSAGVSAVEAAQYAGVGKSTILEWLKRGSGEAQRPATEAYRSLYDAVQKALAADMVQRVARINQAGRGGAVIWRKTVTRKDGRVEVEERTQPPDWQADAWHLERRYYEQWGRKDRIDLRATIDTTARQIAEELGIPVEDLLAEAQARLTQGGAANKVA